MFISLCVNMSKYIYTIVDVFMLGIVTRTETEIVTESMIGKGGGTGHVKGDEAAVVTVVYAENEVAAEKGETMIGEIEMTKV